MIKVLIADDQKLIRESLKIVLDTYQDIQVIDTVGDGKQVLESIKEQEPDVILMDIRMPVMDSIQAGCNAVFSKPYSLEKLKETIEIYIG